MIAKRTIISGSSGPSFGIFSRHERVLHFGCRWSIWTSFSNISRDVVMATNFVENGKLPSFVAVAFQSRIGHPYLNVHVNSVNDASISCTNFVNSGPVTPELTELTCESLVRHGKKMAYLVEYLRKYWANFRFFTIWKCFECRWSICTLFSDLSGDVAMAIKWWWEKRVSNEGSLIPPALFALAFKYELEYHLLYAH